MGALALGGLIGAGCLTRSAKRPPKEYVPGQDASCVFNHIVTSALRTIGRESIPGKAAPVGRVREPALMLSVSRLLNGSISPGDVLRYGRSTGRGPAHLLHYSADKKPVVVWNTTQRCNLHCGHCYSDSKNREYPGELTTAEGLSLIEDLAGFGVPTLLFSGGEPLMRPDLFELAEAARAAGMRTVLSTNATLFDDEAAERAAEVGLSYIGVSIDGIGPRHDKMRGKKGAYEKALRGIAAARRAGLRAGMRFTVHGLNRDQMGSVFELAEEHGVQRLCVYHLAYAGRGGKMRRHDLEPAETRQVVEEIFDRVEELGRRDQEMEVLTVDNPVDGVLLLMRLRRTDPARAVEVEELLRWNGGNQSGVAVASIDPQGKVHPDQFSWNDTVGDIREGSFGEIWNDANPRLKRYRERPRGIRGRCQDCHFYELCNGGLRVRALSASDDFSAPDPACYLSDAEIAG